MTAPASSHTDAIARLGHALGVYGERASEAVGVAGRETRRTAAEVVAALADRQRRLAAAEQDLAACERDPKSDCSEARRRVADAQRRLAAAHRARQLVDQAAARLVGAQRRFATELTARVAEGQAITSRMQSQLEDYLRPVGLVDNAGLGSGNPSGSGGSFSAASTIGMPYGVRTAAGLPDGWALVPLTLIDVSDTGVRGPEDFTKGYSPRDLAWALEAFDSVVLPAVGQGLGRDYFADRDGREGRSGARSFSDSHSGFLGSDAIKLELRPDGRFGVTNGYHRLWVAQELNREWIPARVR